MNNVFADGERLELIELAEETIRQGAMLGLSPNVDLSAWGAWAAAPRATFVTVYLSGALHGCIGTLDARRAVAEDVAGNAFRAAFHDPRFPPLSALQLDAVSVHVSVLGPLEAIHVTSEDDLIRQMRVGVDGIVLDDGSRRGTFLPAVWDKLPDPRDFLANLKRKAGFRGDHWSDDIEVFRFEVEEFDRGSL